MALEFTWGSAAISEGFGAVQDTPDVFDFIFFDSAAVDPEALTSTQGAYSGFLRGQETFMVVEGTNLGYLPDGSIASGQLTSVTLFRLDGDVPNEILTIEGVLDGADVFDAVFAELVSGQVSAIEDLLFAQDWIYNGTSQTDFLPQSAVTVDNVPINLLGDDTVFLLQGDDIFFAGDGDDNVRAASGNDIIYGGNGNDEIRGSTGADELVGGNGNDRLFGQRDDDLLIGGAGNDRLIGGGGSDELEGDTGRDFLKGGFDDDFASGGAGNDIVNGNAGNDLLTGATGNDIVRGGGGDDLLLSIADNDLLKGGGGVDTFAFVPLEPGTEFGGTAAPNAVVLDFNVAEDLLALNDQDITNAANLRTLTGPGLSISEAIATYASVINGNVVFDFGASGTITLNGIGSTDGIENSVVWLSDTGFELT